LRLFELVHYYIEYNIQTIIFSNTFFYFWQKLILPTAVH